MKLDPFRIFVTLATVALVVALISIIGLDNRLASAGNAPEEISEPTTPPGPQIIFLVRHAEKATDDPRDPVLTEEGEARAVELADRLASRGIERVMSTDYHRTRDTAGPLAERLGLVVELYDPTDLPGVARAILDDGRTTLVVGHSNTTPPLVDALGGDSGSPIEDDEYDRLYELTVSDGELTTVLHRFEVPAEVGTG